MAPHLVKEIQASDLSPLDTQEPERMGRAMPADVARTLTANGRGDRCHAT